MKPTTGSDEAVIDEWQRPLKQYETAQGMPASRMVAAEYLDFIKDALVCFKRNTTFRRRSGEALLIHDRSPAHTAACVREGLQQMELRCVVSPTRSPDLDPLDYSVFGLAKTNVKAKLGSKAKWEERVKLLKSELREGLKKDSFQSLHNIIQELPLRLKACEESEGNHITSRLEALKKVRKMRISGP
jgi:hypothetical protein